MAVMANYRRVLKRKGTRESILEGLRLLVSSMIETAKDFQRDFCHRLSRYVTSNFGYGVSTQRTKERLFWT